MLYVPRAVAQSGAWSASATAASASSTPRSSTPAQRRAALGPLAQQQRDRQPGRQGGAEEDALGVFGRRDDNLPRPAPKALRHQEAAPHRIGTDRHYLGRASLQRAAQLRLRRRGQHERVFWGRQFDKLLGLPRRRRAQRDQQRCLPAHPLECGHRRRHCRGPGLILGDHEEIELRRRRGRRAGRQDCQDAGHQANPARRGSAFRSSVTCLHYHRTVGVVAHWPGLWWRARRGTGPEACSGGTGRRRSVRREEAIPFFSQGTPKSYYFRAGHKLPVPYCDAWPAAVQD